MYEGTHGDTEACVVALHGGGATTLDAIRAPAAQGCREVSCLDSRSAVSPTGLLGCRRRICQGGEGRGGVREKRSRMRWGSEAWVACS